MISIRTAGLLTIVLALPGLAQVSVASAQESTELECVFFGQSHWYVKIDYSRRQLAVGPFFPGQAPRVDELEATFQDRVIDAYKNRGGFTVAGFVFDRYAGTLKIVDFDPHSEKTSAPCTQYEVQRRKY